MFIKQKKKKVKIPIWPIIHPEAVFSLINVYLRQNWSWWGKYEIRFIKKFLKIHPATYAIMTVSGTCALESILSALNIKQGDEVIVPALTWISTASAVVKTGAKPVFVDVNPETLCIDSEKIESAITDKTRAIIPVHLFSAMAEMERIAEIAKKYNLKVIEDCAHAVAMQYKGKAAGTIGDAGAFSFQQSKLLTAGEGGMVILNNRKLAEKIDKINHIGCSLYSRSADKDFEIVPSKYVITEFQSAVLENQCNYVLKEAELRQKNAQYLEELLCKTEGIRVQKTSEGTTRRNYFYFVIIVDSDRFKPETNINNVIEDINNEGLFAQNVWGSPVYDYNLWTVPKDLYIKQPCPMAEKISRNEIIALPHTLLLTDKKTIKKAADIILKVLGKYIV